MTQPKKDKYEGWSKARRYEAAVRKVVHENWTQVEAAAEYGIARSNLNPKVRKYREEHAERLAAEVAKPRTQGALSPLGLREKRRFPATFQEFDDHYFGHWQCPDCNKHHERMPFHDEIVNELHGDARRLLVNVPPFHAKSTYGTVKSTVYDVGGNPNIREIIISKSQTFAATFLQSINELLTNHELYQPGRDFIDDWGPFKNDSAQQIWNTKQIYVAGRVTAEKDPTVQVLGVGNQIYGRRADKIRCDDIADVENQRNPEQVLKMIEWIDKMVATRVGKSGQLAFIGTRVHAGDIYSFFKNRAGWKVITYPCILDDTEELVLWPDHFPYEQAALFRSDMSPADFQLIYQNVDLPGLSASFTPEALESCKDSSRVVGHYESGWRLVAGLDPAGGNKKSGYTAMTLTGIDLKTGKRFLIDQVAVKSMRAPQLRDQMFEWTDHYPIYEWRVESNGVQSQIVQYNEEIVRYLARKGVRVTPHQTNGNKWDPQFGVESMAPLFNTEMISIPWGNAQSAQVFQPLLEQLIAFPMGTVTDRVMSMWFADLGCREFLNRSHLPLFNDRMRMPKRIRRRRHVVDYHAQEVRNVPIRDQRRNHLIGSRPGGAREAAGRPSPWSSLEERDPGEPKKFVNVPGFVTPS